MNKRDKHYIKITDLKDMLKKQEKYMQKGQHIKLKKKMENIK
ncbi:MAG: hypothetical protein V8R82_11455 [Clostridia bacterium]